VGLARHALGYEELESNPNPLTDDDAPESIKAVVLDYSMRAAKQASETVKEESEYKIEGSYESARRSKIRGEAKLQSLGVTQAEAIKLLDAYYKHRGWKKSEHTQKLGWRPTDHYSDRKEALKALYATE
jgi:hypothetical protein